MGRKQQPQASRQLSGSVSRAHDLLREQEQTASPPESKEWTRVGAQCTILRSGSAGQAEVRDVPDSRRAAAHRGARQTGERWRRRARRPCCLRELGGASGRKIAPMTTVCTPDTPCHRPVPPGDPATDTTDTLGMDTLQPTPDTAFCSSHQTGSALTAHPLATLPCIS